MAKTATKRKEINVASIKRRLSAALIMLLVSSIMLVATTYAWFTLSTAPEVAKIDTKVAGNGSLEIALVPANGLLGGITSGRNSSGDYAGGNQPAETANNRWGNLIDISGDSYGLNKLELIPATAKIEGTTFTFGVPEFGKDGRITTTSSAGNLKAYNATQQSFSVEGTYGVRAFVSSATAGSNGKIAAYGYVLDLAFRTNTAGNLILEKEALNRIYQTVTEDNALMGGGSKITGAAGDMEIAFVKDFGVVADPAPTAQFLAFAKPDANGELTLYSASASGTIGTAIEDNVLLEDMPKDTPIQISVVVWLEGQGLTNEDLAPAYDTNGDPVVATATLNLQFTNSTALVPMEESTLKTNPPVSKAEQLAAKITEAQTAYDNATEGEAKTALGESITAAQALGANAVAADINAAIADLDEKIAALNQ